MTLPEMVGTLASALVLLTFCMRTMIPLRLAAIASNIAFIVYGAMEELYPILGLHLVLLPLNLYRTGEMMRLIRRVEAAARGDLSVEWLRPFMKPERYTAGTRLFHKGDHASRLFCIVEGEVLLEEIDHRLGPGKILGEIGLFSPERQRTMSASCTTAVEMLAIEEQELAQLCYQNPALAFHLLRLITRRLGRNVAALGMRQVASA